LDDRFSSIVNSIKWGRGVYDNIRKFLQFQLTVNIVALMLVFIGACAGFGQPLNAVMMLWVNLVMDTFGALALGTEIPTNKLLERKPYRRDASLISRPMWRNIFVMSTFQLILLFVLLFNGAQLFGVKQNETCIKWKVKGSSKYWNVATNHRTDELSGNPTVTCTDFSSFCPDKDYDCFHNQQTLTYTASDNSTQHQAFEFSSLQDFEPSCLSCEQRDFVHGTIIFNTFIFCQIFNEYVSRKFDEVNMFDGIETSPMFLIVSVVSAGLQVFLVEVGGEYVKTTPLNWSQWLITIALAAITLPLGALMRYIPIEEDPNSFFDANTLGDESASVLAQGKGGAASGWLWCSQWRRYTPLPEKRVSAV
jgi:magnesium-transporting ATPase (P-type)